MHDDDVGNFRINLADDETDDVLTSEDTAHESPAEETGLEAEETGRKTGRLPLVVMFLLLCVVAAGVLYAYFDIKKRVTANNSQRDVVVNNISRELENRFAVISTDLEKVDKKLDEAVSNLKDTLSRMEGSVNGISSSKADKKKFDAAVKSLEKRFAVLGKDIKTIKGNISDLSQSLDTGLSELNTAVIANTALLNGTSEEMSALKAGKMDKSLFETTFQAEHERYAKLISELNQEVGSLKYKIKTIETQLLKFSTSTGTTSGARNQTSKDVIIEKTIQ